MRSGPAETWVFGYGSLMWNPGFAFAEARPASLRGFHRAFCIYSVHYRGTARQPGLVLGLDRGGVCQGMAFRLAADTTAAALAYLRRRELIYGVYREARVRVDLAPGPGDAQARSVWALAYIAERAHPAYAGRLPLMREAQLIRRSAGFGGTNLDYLMSTRCHLKSLGIVEPRLDRLLVVVGGLPARDESACGRLERCSASRARAWAAKPVATPRMVRDNRFGYRAKCAGVRE